MDDWNSMRLLACCGGLTPAAGGRLLRLLPAAVSSMHSKDTKGTTSCNSTDSRLSAAFSVSSSTAAATCASPRATAAILLSQEHASRPCTRAGSAAFCLRCTHPLLQVIDNLLNVDLCFLHRVVLAGGGCHDLLAAQGSLHATSEPSIVDPHFIGWTCAVLQDTTSLCTKGEVSCTQAAPELDPTATAG